MKTGAPCFVQSAWLRVAVVCELCSPGSQQHPVMAGSPSGSQ